MGRSGRPSRGVLSPPSPCHRLVPQEVTQPQRGLRRRLTKHAPGQKPPRAAGWRRAFQGPRPSLGNPGSWLSCPGPLSVLGNSVIQQTSWAPLKLSPILARSPPAPSPSTFGGRGEKKLKAAVSGWDGGGMPCRCPAVPTASGGSKGAFRSRESLQGSEVGRGRSRGGQGGERAPAQVCRAERSG